MHPPPQSNRISALHHLSTHHFHLPPYLADQAIYRYLHKIEKELNKARIDKEDEYLGAAAMMLVAKRSGRVVLAHDVAVSDISDPCPTIHVRLVEYR